MRRISLPLAVLLFAPADWKELAPMMVAQSGGAAGWLGNDLVIAGGASWINGEKRYLNTTQIYSPDSDSWKNGPEMPEGVAYGPFIATRDKVEVFGGISAGGPLRDAWTLRSSSGHWVKSGDSPADVLLGSAVSVDGSVYILGGCPDAADLTQCSDAVWKRNDEDGQWHLVSRLPQGPLALHAAAAIGSQIYVFGGCSMPEGQVRNHDEAWMFDTRTEMWSKIPSLPQASRGLSAVTIQGKQILLAGGYTEKGFSDAVLTFDPASQTYQAGRSLPAGLLGAAMAARDKHVYVAGGEDKPRSRSQRVFRAELKP